MNVCEIIEKEEAIKKIQEHGFSQDGAVCLYEWLEEEHESDQLVVLDECLLGCREYSSAETCALLLGWKPTYIEKELWINSRGRIRKFSNGIIFRPF
jgi:hypothetical protein